MSNSKENQVFEYSKAQLHYDIYGGGEKILLAFHGFGQSKQHYVKFARSLNKIYTIFSFDLFYHGTSFWHEKEKPLQKKFWKEIIAGFLKEHKIEKFSMAGYSMGGKFVLATLEAFPDRVEKIILMAPDGIKTSFWYSLATYPSWMRKVFRSIVIKPTLFNTLINILSKTGLLDKGILKFARYQMNTREKRRRVYYSWLVFRCLTFNMKKIASLIGSHQVHLDIFIGKYDKMITEKNVQALLRHLTDYHLYILESGHNTLIDEVADFYEFKNQ